MIIHQFNVPFSKSRKIYLPARPGRVLPMNPSGDYEVIEIEVDGSIVNRVKRCDEHVNNYLQRFYQQYGYRGQAYMIRQSSMNFQNLNTKQFTSLLNEIL